MKTYSTKTTEMNASNYEKTPLRASAILNVGIDDKSCFFAL